jgi:hypothetical protein
LNGKTAEIKALAEELTATKELASQAEAFQATAAKLQAEIENKTSEFNAYRLQSETSAELFRAGITDPEDQDLARWRYSKAEDAPPFSEWLASSAPADRHLAGLFAKPAEASPAEPSSAPPAETVAAPPPAAPPANTGAKDGRVTPPPRYSPAEVSAMPLDQLREAIAAGAFK